MKREDIIRMAHEAGILEYGYPVGERVAGELERFADLVAEAEREECAKACDESVIGFGTETQWAQGYVQGIKDVADGIRARSTP